MFKEIIITVGFLLVNAYAIYLFFAERKPDGELVIEKNPQNPEQPLIFMVLSCDVNKLRHKPIVRLVVRNKNMD